MALFQKQPSGNPVQQVIQMRQQGTSDNQIVQSLQKQGLNSQMIFDAMARADISHTSMDQSIPLEHESSQQPADYPYPEEEYPTQQAPQKQNEQYQEQYSPQPAFSSTDNRIQEIAEAIINEKWEELMGEVQKIVVWKEKIETEIQRLKDENTSLKDQFTQLHQGVLGKVSEYDERMRDVSSDLKAVQKVFKDIIPTFTENVAELSRVTKGMKKGR